VNLLRMPTGHTNFVGGSSDPLLERHGFIVTAASGIVSRNCDGSRG
jgi:hypothetical protein